MTNKGKSIYKIITIITLALPLPIYLFISATIFNINPDYIIENIELEEMIVEEVEIEEETYYFAYTENQDAIYNGTTLFKNGVYGFYLDADDVLKLDSGYYSYNDENEEETLMFNDVKLLEKQTQTSYKIPLAFVISALGAGIVLMVINKKMEWYKKYPRVATLLALAMGTIILYIINIFASNILSVFLIATLSWGAYCVEYLVNKGIISSAKAEKIETDIISSLKEALKE